MPFAFICDDSLQIMLLMDYHKTLNMVSIIQLFLSNYSNSVLLFLQSLKPAIQVILAFYVQRKGGIGRSKELQSIECVL